MLVKIDSKMITKIKQYYNSRFNFSSIQQAYEKFRMESSAKDAPMGLWIEKDNEDGIMIV